MTTRLLVAEDSAVQSELLRDDLVGGGYEVVTVADGRAAIDHLAEERVDAVITDVMMPRMDGYELCRRVKQSRELAGIPVILLTSLRDPVDIVRGLECGADNFITKPYEADQLLRRVDTVLRSHDLRLAGRFRMGVEVLVLGHTFTVSAERQQILDMLMSSFEELVNTNDRLREREEQLESTQAALRAQVDVSDRHRRELEASRDEMQRLLDATRVTTWRFDLASGALEWAPNAAEILGVEDEHAVGDVASFFAFVVEDDRAMLQEIIDRLSVGGPDALPAEWEFRGVGTDGRMRWFSVRGHAEGDATGNIAVTGLAMDISRRRELEGQLEAREQMFSGVLGASPDGIVVTDLDGRIRFASDGIRDVLGLDPDDLIGQQPLDHVGDQDQDAVAHTAVALRDVGTGGVRQMRVRLLHVDGHPITADCRVRLLTTAEGVPDGYVTVVRDVTEQAELEAELERARDEAEAANRAKSEYLSRMSHELRTPMNSVLGFAQLLQLSDLEGPDRDSVDRILGAGRHLLQLIDDVLDIARIEAGHLTVSLEPVQIEDVVVSAVELLRPQLEDRNLQLSVDVADAGQVMADRQRLTQVVINLLSNAIKYNHEDGEVQVTWSSVEPDACRLAVCDTGQGVPDELRPRLFETFDRLGADQTEVAGTGLGLALSRTLMDAMDGRIGHEPNDGGGSIFWVELPCVRVEECPEADTEAVPTVRETAAVPADILYVEDNPLNVELVARALDTRPGTTLRTAASGRDGLAMAQDRRPDLVLLDLQLPEMSGREVLRRLRTDPTLQDVPVIVLSADATMGTADRVRDGGADAYLTKPLDLADLHTTIDRLLAQGETAPGAQAPGSGEG